MDRKNTTRSLPALRRNGAHCGARRDLCNDRRMLALLQRLLAGLPDALTAGAFLLAWFAPGQLGLEHVRNLLLTLLFEFIVIHSSAFFAVLVAADLSRNKRIIGICLLSALYLVFVLAFALAFHSSWPVLAFGWLFLSRFLQLWTLRQPDEDLAARIFSGWVISIPAYLAGAFGSMLLPLPHLGFAPKLVAALAPQIPTSMAGQWAAEPWTGTAFGAFYFGVLALSKFAGFSITRKSHVAARAKS
jgi:hypothetical protein